MQYSHLKYVVINLNLNYICFSQVMFRLWNEGYELVDKKLSKGERVRVLSRTKDSKIGKARRKDKRVNKHSKE